MCWRGWLPSCLACCWPRIFRPSRPCHPRHGSAAPLPRARPSTRPPSLPRLRRDIRTGPPRSPRPDASQAFQRPYPGAFGSRYGEAAPAVSAQAPGEGTSMSNIAAITGAASGIGRGTADRLLADGWHVVALDRDEAGLAALRKDFASRGDHLTTLRGD